MTRFECPTKIYKTRNMNEFSIHDATRINDLCGVKQLIEVGVSVDRLNEDGLTPLHVAARHGSYEVAELLINSECGLDVKDRRFGRTPAMWAAEKGSNDIVDLLLRRGAHVNCVDAIGRTLLHYAASQIHPPCPDILRLILDNGEADLNAADREGFTPLMLAAHQRNEWVATALIQAGADVNRSGSSLKRTALHWAASVVRPGMIQIFLKKEGLNLSAQDVNGDTPLHITCRASWRPVCRGSIQHFLDAGADPNVRNNRGRTALNEGIETGDLTHEQIRLFVQKGAFLEKCDYKGMSWDTFLKKNVLMDVELCTQSVVNKFNHQSLPALKGIANFARRLPNVDNFKLGARHIDEVENLVKREIEMNTFCNVVKVYPISLSALCVLSLITCQSGKGRNKLLLQV